MDVSKILTILRSEYGYSLHLIEQAQREAADIIEKHYLDKEGYYSNEIQSEPEEIFGVLRCEEKKGAPKNYIEEGKYDMSELPLDLLAELLCPAYQEGTQFKYYRNSWRLGFKMTVMFAACLRHLTKFFFMRETYDQETLEKYDIKKHHLGAAIFCIVSMFNDWKNHPENDDRREVE